MRRTIIAALLAWCAGFTIAGASAYGYALLDAWRGYGDNFQLGYIIGYLDAAALVKRHDMRVYVPTGGRPNFERWRDLVNAYYADPANAKRSIPDAMSAAGKQIGEEMMQAYRKRLEARRSPAPSPAPPDAGSGVSGPD